MSGLRLDRRADADARRIADPTSDLAAPTAAVCITVVVGTAFGPQMPPAGPLSAEQIETIKTVDRRRRRVAGRASRRDAPAPPADPDATRLMTLDSRGRPDRDRCAPAPAIRAPRKSRGARGSTPLMAAALLRRCRAGQATRWRPAPIPTRANGAGATALMWAAPDVDNDARCCSTPAPTSTRDRTIGASALVVTSGIVGARAGVAAAARLRRRPVDPRSRPIRRRCAKRARVDDAGDVRAAARSYGASAKRAGVAGATFVRANCFAVRRRSSASTDRCRAVRPSRARRSTAPRYDPGRASAADADRRRRRRRRRRSAPRSRAACRCSRTSASRS